MNKRNRWGTTPLAEAVRLGTSGGDVSCFVWGSWAYYINHPPRPIDLIHPQTKPRQYTPLSKPGHDEIAAMLRDHGACLFLEIDSQQVRT